MNENKFPMLIVGYYVCECGNFKCQKEITITHEEYREHASRTRYILSPECSLSPEDKVTFQCDRFKVVESLEA